MKKFLIYTSLFGLLLLLTFGSGEWIIRCLPSPYKVKHQWMQMNAQKAECLILGSSHTYYGIQPVDFLPNTFNLANVSQNPEYDFRLLEKYIPQCKALHTVVVPISYFTFFDKNFEDSDEWFLEIYYQLYMNIRKYSFLSKYNFEISNRPVYVGKLQSFFSGKQLPICDSLGFGLGYDLDAKVPEWKEKAAITAERHTSKDGKVNAESEKYLRKTAQLCRKNSVRLVLVTLPASKSYYSLLDEKQLNETHRIVRSICNDYQLSYFDFLKDERFVDDDFFDSDHLSSRGAQKFSAIFKHALLHSLGKSEINQSNSHDD